APGIAHAQIVVHWMDEEEIPLRKISVEELPEEIARFESALIATRAELLEIQQRIADAIGTKDASIFDAHLLVVEDRTLIDEVLRNLEKDRHNVEYAFHQVAEKYCRTLGDIDDPYLRERVVDIEDVARRVIRHLLGKAPHTLASEDKPHIIVSHNLTPSDTASINRALVLGFATEQGSKTSHTAIMARSMDIPAIVGLHDICSTLTSGDDVLLDGYNGLLIVNPSAETLKEYGSLELKKEAVEERLELIRDTSSTTSDGRHIILSANIELPDEIGDVTDSGAEGVGLYRTEFLYLNRTTPPDEEEQYENYRLIAERTRPHSVIIRTLDIGGDKPSESLKLDEEQNPFLGCRAVRFCLQNIEIFKTQLRAILRAAVVGNVRVMYPMISGLDELRQANAILEECKEELRERGAEFHPDLEVGIMIEVPSAALCADHLAREVKFFSIGTNDLIQYAIAVDRGNDRIAHLFEPTHPAIVRMIKGVVDAAHHQGIWVGVCGEMAGDITLTPLLLGLGVDELSASCTVVPRVKKAVQSLDIPTCRALAEEAAQLGSASDILHRCLEVAVSHYGELLD
ncbi:MAG TPA: phosphoenolpyruvate--protein phosphotransferase, partial [Terrimicrobiaceae bacterium]|nr:phosphoenolpyruvate--protein phosphotransferase [Terrimicrobiaceae bacterium]